jgi:acyl CoA:acetate/3-ketoacid CoA transferase alpha subunit|tara:strand:+ start:327 stop:725 length:399 start_codon:yes stop_codon:yes gene_type:complete
MAVFTAISMVMNMKAAKQQKKAQREQQKQQQVAARRSRVQAVRQAQIAQSQARASGAGMGALETSGLRGGLASNQAQLGEGLGFSTQMSGLSQNISMFQQKAADFRGYGQLAAGLGNLTWKAAGMSGLKLTD